MMVYMKERQLHLLWASQRARKGWSCWLITTFFGEVTRVLQGPHSFLGRVAPRTVSSTGLCLLLTPTCSRATTLVVLEAQAFNPWTFWRTITPDPVHSSNSSWFLCFFPQNKTEWPLFQEDRIPFNLQIHLPGTILSLSRVENQGHPSKPRVT